MGCTGVGCTGVGITGVGITQHDEGAPAGETGAWGERIHEGHAGVGFRVG